MSFKNEYFSVGEIFSKSCKILWFIFKEFSLVLSSLSGESGEFILDNFKGLLNNLSISADMDGIDCVGEVLNFNFCFGCSNFFIIKFVLESGDEFFNFRWLLVQSTIFYFLVQELYGLFCFGS